MSAIEIIGAILITLVSYLGNRTLSQIDKNISKLMGDFDTLKEKYLENISFTDKLEKELADLKRECSSLRKSFNYIDKLLYAKNIKINHSESDQDGTD